MSAGRAVLGFYAWRTHRVVEVQECPLLHPLANGILEGLRNWMGERSKVPIKGADIQVSPDEGKGVVSLRIEASCHPKMVEEIGQRISGVKGMSREGEAKNLLGRVDPLL